MGEQLGDQTVFGQQKGEQDMGLLDLLIGVFGADGLGVLDGLQGFLGIFLSVHNAVHILSEKK